jgi:hypothetical protein
MMLSVTRAFQSRIETIDLHISERNQRRPGSNLDSSNIRGDRAAMLCLSSVMTAVRVDCRSLAPSQ